jgi:hypothetical protein
MRVREVYDYLLTETNKVEAPSLLLESFNFFLGKAINETCNQWYTFYEQNQLLTDNLRVLTKFESLPNAYLPEGNFYKIPSDYWHLLPGSIINFTRRVDAPPSCSISWLSPVIKMDSQMYSGIIKDYYTKPSYKRPYLYMHQHTANNVTYEIEIKSGDTSLYIPTDLQIQYLRKPKLPNKTLKEGTSLVSPDPTNLYLTQEEIEADIDISQILEFPENFCYEIVNKLTALVLEQTGDIRLQNNIPLNQSMVPPKQG